MKSRCGNFYRSIGLFYMKSSSYSVSKLPNGVKDLIHLRQLMSMDARRLWIVTQINARKLDF